MGLSGYLIRTPPLIVTAIYCVPVLLNYWQGVPSAIADVTWILTFALLGFWQLDLYLTGRRATRAKLRPSHLALFALCFGALIVGWALHPPQISTPIQIAVGIAFNVAFVGCSYLPARDLVRFDRQAGTEPPSHIGNLTLLILMLPIGIWFMWWRVQRLADAGSSMQTLAK